MWVKEKTYTQIKMYKIIFLQIFIESRFFINKGFRGTNVECR